MSDLTEKELVELESVANTLRGGSMDPRLPNDVKQILMENAKKIDTITEPRTNIS